MNPFNERLKKLGLRALKYKFGDHFRLVYNKKSINLIAHGILYDVKLLKQAKVWVNN